MLFKSIQQLPIGQVGTILEIYPGKSPRYLVEFADLLRYLDYRRGGSMNLVRSEDFKDRHSRLLALEPHLDPVQQAMAAPQNRQQNR